MFKLVSVKVPLSPFPLNNSALDFWSVDWHMLGIVPFVVYEQPAD